MEFCKECGRPKISKEEFEKILGAPYIITINDQKFLEYLRRNENDKNI